MIARCSQNAERQQEELQIPLFLSKHSNMPQARFSLHPRPSAFRFGCTGGLRGTARASRREKGKKGLMPCR
jgi:hypothetical protein